MRIFGLIGLIVALLIVGLLAKKSLTTTSQIHIPALPATTVASDATGTGAITADTVRAQTQQVQKQYQQAVESALQQPAREMPAEAQ